MSDKDEQTGNYEAEWQMTGGRDPRKVLHVDLCTRQRLPKGSGAQADLEGWLEKGGDRSVPEG